MNFFPNPWIDSCPRKNRVKQDDVYVEMPLFELEIKYGGTEAGRRLYLLTSWCLIRKSNFAPVMGISDCGGFPNYILENFAWFGAPLFSIFSICSIHLFAREYIQDIQKSQKGRPHPDRQAWPMHGLQFWFSREFHQTPWLCQFRNNPKYRVYKVYKLTEHKSGPGLVVPKFKL